jgi:hypothetical protein
MDAYLASWQPPEYGDDDGAWGGGLGPPRVGGGPGGGGSPDGLDLDF